MFDVSQMKGGNASSRRADCPARGRLQYADAALRKLSPVPVVTAPISGSAKGYFSHTEQRIVMRPNMSETQTVKTLIHEITHAKLHARPATDGMAGGTIKDRRTREVEAESVAYVVCQHFGIETSDYSFAYIAGWSKGRELVELKESLDCIRETAAGLIKAWKVCAG